MARRTTARRIIKHAKDKIDPRIKAAQVAVKAIPAALLRQIVQTEIESEVKEIVDGWEDSYSGRLLPKRALEEQLEKRIQAEVKKPKYRPLLDKAAAAIVARALKSLAGEIADESNDS